MELEEGDLIEIELDVPWRPFDKARAIVVKIFDALTADGEPGINLEIDIKFGKRFDQWFRYKPFKDGGTYRIIRKAKK